MLQNKIALVTGGSRGIGAEIVKQFAKERATIVLPTVIQKTESMN